MKNASLEEAKSKNSNEKNLSNTNKKNMKVIYKVYHLGKLIYMNQNKWFKTVITN